MFTLRFNTDNKLKHLKVIIRNPMVVNATHLVPLVINSMLLIHNMHRWLLNVLPVEVVNFTESEVKKLVLSVTNSSLKSIYLYGKKEL